MTRTPLRPVDAPASRSSMTDCSTARPYSTATTYLADTSLSVEMRRTPPRGISLRGGTLANCSISPSRWLAFIRQYVRAGQGRRHQPKVDPGVESAAAAGWYTNG